MADLGTVLSVAQTLFAALDSPVLKEAYAVSKYESEVERLKTTVTTVKCVLIDAEKKAELLSQTDLDYIHKLKDAVYDADDLFDEFRTISALKQNANFFDKNLAGLKSLEVELPDIPCYQRSTRPDLWFRWGGKFGVHGVANHCVFVFGDRVTSGVSKEARATKQLLRGLTIAVRHGWFHYIMYELGTVGNSWKTGLTITTRDAGGNGGLAIGPCSIDGGESLLFQIFHLPSTLKFRHGSTEDGDDEQDVMLMFFATIRTDLHGEATNMDDDLLKACFRVTDDKEGEAATQTTELCHLVQQILAHEKCEKMYAT